MIKVILKGGLGNQIFQYAFGKSLALEKNEELVLDLSLLNCRIPVKGFTTRKYELDLFGVTEKTGSLFGTGLLDKYLSYPVEKIVSRFNPAFFQEGANPYSYSADLVIKALKSDRNVVFEGYWNNYKYFEKHQNEIKAIFDVDRLYDEEFKEIEEQIKSCDSVSINIRRGDYLNAKHKDIFVYLDKNYYSRATEMIRSKIKNPRFFVFSYDAPEWIKTQLDFKPTELVIVGREYAGDRFKTYLRLISLCKHNILSNSTFAFWGGFLNKNPDKIVVSPREWMYGREFEAPPGWNLI